MQCELQAKMNAKPLLGNLPHSMIVHEDLHTRESANFQHIIPKHRDLLTNQAKECSKKV